ncbi:MAG TPA: hypothetical protein VMT10_06290 [Solirubrobacteraceae bacterium]|nr:hypothetical protein [Solirubrobacteraceae bacterium]
MPRPSPSLSRYLLLSAPTPRHREAGAPKVRRYRLARIQVGGRPVGTERFAHLQRSYD